ncbi:MAG: hypothetical protein CM1200mP24_01090 [Gammaproteobacteria bacterium]|nr:MAG: hypothetical protein CM1200mP24_01090 [Gammaproteobacteria bacterium]
MTTEHPQHFRDLALPPKPLNKAIDDLGFENCTPIQGQCCHTAFQITM